MTKLNYRITVVVVIVAFLAGCASIVSKSEWPVTINSKPDGADITITNSAKQNVFTGKTPTTVILKAGAGYFKGEDYTVTFMKEGYPPHTAQIKRAVNGWYIAGNLVFGGLIGWLIVDPLTGAMWTLENLQVDLNTSSTSSNQNTLRIVTIDQVPAQLRTNMVKIN